MGFASGACWLVELHRQTLADFGEVGVVSVVWSTCRFRRNRPTLSGIVKRLPISEKSAYSQLHRQALADFGEIGVLSPVNPQTGQCRL